MNGEDPKVGHYVTGPVKWFDPAKGFGFLADPDGGTDVLLHSNVLRNFGQSSVVEGVLVEVRAVRTARGRQAVEVLSVGPASFESGAPIAELDAMDADALHALALLPARVKWFDRTKGFGFANVFGRKGDVFLHLEVLRHGGFADLLPGEAIGLRVFTAARGMIAAQVVAWEKAVSEGGTCMDGKAGAPAQDAAPVPDSSRTDMTDTDAAFPRATLTAKARR